MRFGIRLISLAFLLLTAIPSAQAKVVVFWQEGFPTVDSQPVTRENLSKSLQELGPAFANLDELKQRDALKDVGLLIMPYGSAFPADAWTPILAHLQQGGNLLNLGGRPFYVPVFQKDGKWMSEAPQNTYSRVFGLSHSYVVPQKEYARFSWNELSPSFAATTIKPQQVYALGMWWNRPEYRGLGHFLNAKGEKVASPVTKADFISLHSNEQAAFRGSRSVFLNFDPAPGYWESPEGTRLIRETAAYASRGAAFFRVELESSSLLEGETPQLNVYLRNVKQQRQLAAQKGIIHLELLSDKEVLASAQIQCSGDSVAKSTSFQKPLKPGFYHINATYEDGGKAWEAYQTGFWVRDEKLLKSETPLTVGETYYQKDGKPLLAIGTNYFTTDVYWYGFIGGNALAWERDFDEMEKGGINFVRTGVWSNHADLLDELSGAAKERFLRGLEAYLLSAARHHIHVNFTFWAFDPQTVRRHPGEASLMVGPGVNPYTDPVAIRAQKNYLLSIVERFKDVPHVSWDLINEPSFSNPKRIWKNVPNGDPTELAAWNNWLEKRYLSLQNLAMAWATPAEDLGTWGSISLPTPEQLDPARYGNFQQIRALDYNLFVQDLFRQWTREMVSAIRSTGSQQMVDVGQDEGGVSDRVLNQFYGDGGVAFTVNHTWWRDDALLWDSVVAKRPGVPNLVGETGVQPAWRVDNTWRWDELTALGLLEKKLALGLGAANCGSLQWDWSRDDTFGIKRSDGANKVWQAALSGIAEFARKASPFMTGAKTPEVAIVLPQSLQLSIFNRFALEAQQQCVRALYHVVRAPAYVVGEYQIQLLGNPKLIILPSPWILNQQAWEAVLEKVRAGSTLLVTGRFDADEHFHPTRRHEEAGISYQAGLLDTRENLVRWPGEQAWLTFSGDKCTYLERAYLPENETFIEKNVGRGKILFCPLPIELNDNLQAIGSVYRLAMDRAKVTPVYSTALEDPGILICPTQAENATLYVLTSESSSTRSFSFRDARSGKELTVQLEPTRAALLLVGKDGQVLATYNPALPR